MEIPESLQTIAEISIAFAGFTGLIVALRRSAGPLTDVQKYRLRVLLSMAFGAMFVSLLPDTLVNLGVGDATVWWWSCTVMAVYSIAFLVWWLIGTRRIVREAPEIFHWSAYARMAVGHAIILFLLVSVVLGFEPAESAGILHLGLIWYLIHAAQQFVRMLFIQPRGA